MKTDEHGNIHVTHINIRESITFLLARVFVLDILVAIVILVFFTTLCQFLPTESISQRILSYHSLFFILLGILKISLTIYIILEWLNEYYEVTPVKIIHKKGVLWRKEQHYALEYIRTIKLNQSMFGRVFNFGTIDLCDIRRNVVVDLYLIHNPHRYMKILEQLVVNPHEEKRIIKQHLFGEDIEEEDTEDIIEKQLGKHYK